MNKTRAFSTLALLGSLAAAPALADYSLTIFHNNDGESQLFPTEIDGDLVGGASRFVSVLERERALAGNSLTLSSGDNFLAGPVIVASGNQGRYFDAEVLGQIGYDAITLGNHDFDFGTDFLGNFISDYRSYVTDDLGGTPAPFLSANLDFSASNLQGLVDSGAIKPSTIVNVGGEDIGVIGLTTPELPFISNPGNVVVTAVTELDQVDAINNQVQLLEAQGVNKIILSSHLQSINNEVSLAAKLAGIDAIVSGGGDELLANDTDPLIPGDTKAGDYPLTETDLNGSTVPVVTTPGSYQYLGELNVDFDDNGVVTSADGMLHRVVDTSVGADGVTTNPGVEALLGDLQEVFDSAQVIGSSQVRLDGVRENVRTRATNMGSLIIDAMLDAAAEGSTVAGADTPVIGLTNAGGIRNSIVIEAGEDITDLTTNTILPFRNKITIIEDVPIMTLLQSLERGVSAVEDTSGRFNQVSGFSFTYNPDGTAQTLELDGEGNPIGIEIEGDRIVDVFLDDGTQIIEDGEIVEAFAGLSFDIATNNFQAGGGDGYFFLEALNRIELDIEYDEALNQFIMDDLNGVVPASLYPELGDQLLPEQGMGDNMAQRIGVVPEPTSLALLGLGGLLIARRRRAA